MICWGTGVSIDLIREKFLTDQVLIWLAYGSFLAGLYFLPAAFFAFFFSLALNKNTDHVVQSHAQWISRTYWIGAAALVVIFLLGMILMSGVVDPVFQYLGLHILVPPYEAIQYRGEKLGISILAPILILCLILWLLARVVKGFVSIVRYTAIENARTWMV